MIFCADIAHFIGANRPRQKAGDRDEVLSRASRHIRRQRTLCWRKRRADESDRTEFHRRDLAAGNGAQTDLPQTRKAPFSLILELSIRAAA